MLNPSSFASRSIPITLISSPSASIVRQACLAALICAALAPLALLMDLPAAQYFLADRLPGDLQRVLRWSELFGHGFGVLIIAATLLVIDTRNRWRLPRVLAAALGAGLTADVVKLLVARLRPRYFDFGHGVLDSFAGWIPILNPVQGIGKFGYGLQSFPSAHAAVAMGLAVGLAHLYPRGRYLFVGFAVLAAMQRLESGAHYVSDVLVGAAIGLLFGAALTGSKYLGKGFDRLEQRGTHAAAV